MAKKTQRMIINLQCTKCKRFNYTTSKNKINSQTKVELQKFCKWCKEKTLHKESKLK